MYDLVREKHILDLITTLNNKENDGWLCCGTAYDMLNGQWIAIVHKGDGGIPYQIDPSTAFPKYDPNWGKVWCGPSPIYPQDKDNTAVEIK